MADTLSSEIVRARKPSGLSAKLANGAQSALGAIPLLVLLAAWEMTSRSGVYTSVLLPSPTDVVKVFINDWSDLLKHTQASVSRVLIGVSIAFVTAVPFGLFFGRFSILDRIMDWSV